MSEGQHVNGVTMEEEMSGEEGGCDRACERKGERRRAIEGGNLGLYCGKGELGASSEVNVDYTATTFAR